MNFAEVALNFLVLPLINLAYGEGHDGMDAAAEDARSNLKFMVLHHESAAVISFSRQLLLRCSTSCVLAVVAIAVMLNFTRIPQSNSSNMIQQSLTVVLCDKNRRIK